MTLNIKALANRFYMKYYPEILSSDEADLDKHHGCMQEKFGSDCKHIDFFDNFVHKDFEDTGEYSRFKAEIFGIGKSKFSIMNTIFLISIILIAKLSQT